jgi:chlorophyll/bacteriochlorophyll a synthase
MRPPPHAAPSPARNLSGIDAVRPSPGAVLELLKPITWFAPMWAYMCGVVSAGQPLPGRAFEIALGIALAGPLVCGTSQAVNDWFDRHVDAVNEPNRPIPSGRIPGRWGLWIGIGWTVLSLIIAAILGPLTLGAAIIGLALAWAYSAPPLRLKENGWAGAVAVAACYEGLPWFTGATIMAGGMPSGAILALAALYSIGAVGIMVLNDFKAIEGDSKLGVRSVPVMLGTERAALFACAIMALPQVIVIALLAHWGLPRYALIIAALLAVQAWLMTIFLKNPREKAPWYNATGTSLYVLGMLASAIAVR